MISRKGRLTQERTWMGKSRCVCVDGTVCSVDAASLTAGSSPRGRQLRFDALPSSKAERSSQLSVSGQLALGTLSLPVGLNWSSQGFQRQAGKGCSDWHHSRVGVAMFCLAGWPTYFSATRHSPITTELPVLLLTSRWGSDRRWYYYAHSFEKQAWNKQNQTKGEICKSKQFTSLFI